jgi:hypothetical protein
MMENEDVTGSLGWEAQAIVLITATTKSSKDVLDPLRSVAKHYSL